VLKGLESLQDDKKIHRDIKPANLLINHFGNVKISDLGIVRDLEDDAEAADTFTGTYTYMSPERIVGGKYSYNSDIWSLGLTVMTVAIGKFPFQKEAEGGYWALLQALREKEIESMNEFMGEDVFSDEFEDFVKLCLVKDPKERLEAKDLLKHPFVCNVDVDSDPSDSHEVLEGEGSDTARSELEDITCAVIEYYKKLWVKQSESDVGLTVPNFNKAKLRRLGNQIALEPSLVSRKMKSVLKRLKQELVSSGIGVGGAGGAGERKDDNGDSFYSEFSSRSSMNGAGAHASSKSSAR
jgi:serine/threonine protein kinase